MRVSYRNPQADAWFETILKDPAAFPFRFRFGGRLIQGFPDSEFACESRSVRREKGRETAEIRFRKDGALFVTLKCAHYWMYGVTEWTVWFDTDFHLIHAHLWASFAPSLCQSSSPYLRKPGANGTRTSCRTRKPFSPFRANTLP